LAGGRDLFRYVVWVDVVIGPLLTFLVYDKNKSKKLLVKDICALIALQILALVYGLYSVYQARPIFLAYEGNRFRLVSATDIENDSLMLADVGLRNISLTGPKLLGVKLSDGNDPDFPRSIQLSMAGIHPAFRPERWVYYESQMKEVSASLYSLDILYKKNTENRLIIKNALDFCHLSQEKVGYLPLSAEKATPVDWVVLVDREAGLPCKILPMDGW
jgi:hypothetical protein